MGWWWDDQWHELSVTYDICMGKYIQLQINDKSETDSLLMKLQSFVCPGGNFRKPKFHFSPNGWNLCETHFQWPTMQQVSAAWGGTPRKLSLNHHRPPRSLRMREYKGGRWKKFHCRDTDRISSTYSNPKGGAYCQDVFKGVVSAAYDKKNYTNGLKSSGWKWLIPWVPQSALLGARPWPLGNHIG